jgi:hypothetical protein
MPRTLLTRYPPNYRPITEERSYGVSALMLVAMVKEEAAFDAAAMAEAWDFEPPTSTPVPYAETPREVALARIGAWSRHLDGKRAARRADKIDFKALRSASGEPNASPTYIDSPPEIASVENRAKSKGKMPNKNPWGKRRRLTPAEATSVRRAS